MVTVAAIIALLNQRKNRLLLIAEAALPDKQFRAFRRLVLTSSVERDWRRTWNG